MQTYINLWGYGDYELSGHKDESDALVEFLEREGSAYAGTILLTEQGLGKSHRRLLNFFEFDLNEELAQRDAERSHARSCQYPGV